MTKTQAEVKKVAEGIVHLIVAEIMTSFDTVQKAIHKTNKTAWQSLLSELVEDTDQILLDNFSATDL